VLRARAQEDAELIRALVRFPAFEAYYRRRLIEKLEPLREQILGQKLTLEDYRERQTRMHCILELLAMPDQDLLANLQILQR
jgi:hypothetical protein